MIYFSAHVKMSYYFFNRRGLLQKQKDRQYNSGGKENAVDCYIVKF